MDHASAAARRAGQGTRLRWLRVYQPTQNSEEAAAVVLISGRPRAVAARFDRHDTDQWRCTALRVML
ncbi:MAG: Rv3235 family protein [Pseudonocardia sp.]